jgi:hypothetical protein
VQELRKKFVDDFKVILKYWNAEKEHEILTFLLGKLLTNAIAFKNKDNLKEYFVLTSYILSKTPAAILSQVYKTEVKGLVVRLFELIKKERSEDSNEAINKALEGYLTLIKHLISLEDQKVQNEILSYVVNECLFSENDPKCKSSPARR